MLSGRRIGWRVDRVEFVEQGIGEPGRAVGVVGRREDGEAGRLVGDVDELCA